MPQCGIAIKTLADVWHNVLDKWPDKIAAHYLDQSFTYRELNEKALALRSRLLSECGLKKGDRVAIAAPNCVEFLVIYWACVGYGLVLVPVNHRLRPEGMKFIVDDSDSSVLFVHHDTWSALEPVAGNLPGVKHVISIGFDRPGARRFEAMIAPGAPQPPAPNVREEDLAVIVYTSGTTGQPKGPMISHANLVYNIHNTIISHSFRHEDVHMLVVPLFHCTGLNSIITASAYLGSTVAIAPRPNVVELADIIEKRRVTTFLGVPTLMYFFVTMRDFDKHDFTSLRLIAYSGSPMPPATIRKLRSKLPGVMLHNFFGLTETISITNVLASCDAIDYAESVGKALPDIGMKVLDDEGRDLPPGTVGELCFRKENVIDGYWKRPGLLEKSITPDGWFRTGDYALIDKDGYVFLRGRKKDMIIVGGENVYALEVEQVLFMHDKILEAAVVGVPATGARSYMGELVKAVIVVKPGETLAEQDVKGFCWERLTSYQTPQIIEFVDSLPRNPSGKVMKESLK
jgi:long-chain acyl-CoA synthetase